MQNGTAAVAAIHDLKTGHQYATVTTEKLPDDSATEHDAAVKLSHCLFATLLQCLDLTDLDLTTYYTRNAGVGMCQ